MPGLRARRTFASVPVVRKATKAVRTVPDEELVELLGTLGGSRMTYSSRELLGAS